ncbi:MAG: hypothetical protein KDA80_09935 [Planctomycetaceae bacterium]|nr:hypothetical protein [Planctomycetaceae bacterium]
MAFPYGGSCVASLDLSRQQAAATLGLALNTDTVDPTPLADPRANEPPGVGSGSWRRTANVSLSAVRFLTDQSKLAGFRVIWASFPASQWSTGCPGLPYNSAEDVSRGFRGTSIANVGMSEQGNSHGR